MSAPHRGGAPDADALGALTGQRPALRKATAASPVLGVTSAPPAPEPDPEPDKPPKRKKKKVGGWNDYPENLERIRRAWYWTRTEPDGFENISEMIARVLMDWAQGMERKHNGGAPFPETGKVSRSSRT